MLDSLPVTRLAADEQCGVKPAAVRDSGRIDRVVIINDFIDAQGGATAIALIEARELRRQGLAVTFIAGDSPSEDLERLGIEQVTLGMPALLAQSAWRAMASGVHNTAALRMIAQWLRHNDTQRTVYHLHNWSQILSPAVFEALRPVEDRLVVTCHDFFNVCPNGGFTHFNRSQPCAARPLSAACLTSQCDRRSPAQKYWRTLRQWRLNEVARFKTSEATFTFLHERMQARFHDGGFSARNVLTIANPVEAWTDRRIEAEKNRGFLFVGRAGRDKGADLAIGAASASGQTLTIVGAGEITASSHGDDRHVRFAGWRDRPEIAEIARSARALIVPSRVVEPFGLVLLEAAMSGLPVVVSSHAYLAEQAVSLGFAETFETDRDGSLAELLGKLASDDTLVARMSRAGFEHAKSLCHSPRGWADKIVAVFESKLDRPAGQNDQRSRGS